MVMNDDIVYTLELYSGNSDMQNLLVSVFNSFTLIEYHGYEGRLTDLITAESYMTGSDLSDKITSLIKTDIISILEEFSLTVVYDASFYNIATTFNGIVTLSTNNDFDQVLEVVNDDELSTYDIITEVLYIVSGVQHTLFQDTISDVAPVLLTRVRNRIEEQQSLMLGDYVGDNTVNQNNIKELSVKYPQSIAIRLIRDGVSIDREIEFYLGLLDTDTSLDSLAIDIYSILVMTDRYTIEGIEFIKDYIINTIYPTNIIKSSRLINIFTNVDKV